MRYPRSLLPFSEQRRSFLGAARQTCGVGVEAHAIELGIRLWSGGPGYHRYAIHRTWCNAQLTACAKLGYHGMHLAAAAHDRIDRARGQAFDASDAALLVDDCDQRGTLRAVLGIERQHATMEQRGEGGDGCRAAGWTLIDLREAVFNCPCIRTTAVITAASALSLGQQGVYVVGGRHVVSGSNPFLR